MKCDISIIYVYYNTPNEILDSIKSIKNSIGKYTYEIIIVDNNSPLKLPFIKDKKKIITNKLNKGFGKAVNQGVKKARGEYVVILNPDTVLFKNSIKTLIDKLKSDSSVGIVGPQMINQKKEILSTTSGSPTPKRVLFSFSILNRIFPNNRISRGYWLSDIKKNKEQEVDVIGGACMVLKKDLFVKIGGFDERFFMYFEESDLSMRVRRLGLKIVYLPKAKIMHYVGKSSNDKVRIKKIFQTSRYKFLKKHHGKFTALLIEGLIRYLTFTNMALFIILLISAFINLYKINTLMLFIGDMGRDYLAARDMVLTGKIPLIGIQSSVKWLHQGPISVYIIGLSFLIGKYNPVFPAIIYGIIGIITTFLVYIVGKNYINKQVGLMAALFFATSPLVAINTRMPYHTSSIPLFACIFFLILLKVVNKNKSLLFFLFLSLGLLLQVELSNAVLFFLLLVLVFFNRSLFRAKDYVVAILGLFVGILPFIIYDLSHRFVQTFGFALWVANRIRIFLRIATPLGVSSSHEPNVFFRIYQQLAGIIFPESVFVFYLTIVLILISLITYKKWLNDGVYDKKILILVLWFIVPMFGFIVHKAPGVAYFPLLYPVVSIFAAAAFFSLYKRFKFIFIIYFFVVFLNSFFLINKDYYLATNTKYNPLPPESYSFGYAFNLQQDITDKIISDAKGKEFNLKGGGYFATLTTGMDNYKYLIWYKGGKVSPNASITYTIYEDPHVIKDKNSILYNNKIIYLTKDEKK